jgi:lysozyme
MHLRNKLLAGGAAGFIALAGAFLGPIESGPQGPQLVPYADIGGVPTWCYGETAGTPKQRYTDAECTVLLRKSLDKHWAGIAKYVPEKAPESLKAAMLSVAYNVGVTGWVHPVFIKPLARGDWEAACAAITAPWKGRHGVAKGFKATVQGKPVRGLENRRQKEYELCRQSLP